jgi:hypothetical protein
MKAVALSILAVVAFAASAIVILERVAPRDRGAAKQEPAPPAAPTTDPQLLKRLAGIETRLKSLADGLRPAPAESRGSDEGPPLTVPQRLEAIEASLFDFERNARRELRQLYDKTRQRFDEVDVKLAELTSRPATPAQRAKFVEDLAKQGVLHDPAAKRFEVKGEFGQPTRVLEFIAVGEGGRAHESLTILNVVPSAMKRAAVDLGLKPGKAADFTQGRPPEGEGMYVYAAWEGRARPVRAEKLVRNTKTGGQLTAGPLVYIGSREFVKEVSWDTYFAADVYQNLVGIVWKYSGDMVFAASEPAGDDEYIWAPNPDLVPAPGTALRMIFCMEPVAEWDRD